MWCRLRKLATFEDSKMACSNRRCFGCEKGLVFSSCKATRKRKAFSQHSKTSTFHHTQTNVQLQISSAKNHCELAAKQPFFETSQSCVSTTVTLSHRFKAFSPAFCRQNRFRHEPPEIFAEIFFGRALNRPWSPEVRKPLVYFWFFSYTRKE